MSHILCIIDWIHFCIQLFCPRPINFKCFRFWHGYYLSATFLPPFYFYFRNYPFSNLTISWETTWYDFILYMHNKFMHNKCKNLTSYNLCCTGIDMLTRLDMTPWHTTRSKKDIQNKYLLQLLVSKMTRHHIWNICANHLII